MNLKGVCGSPCCVGKGRRDNRPGNAGKRAMVGAVGPYSGELNEPASHYLWLVAEARDDPKWNFSIRENRLNVATSRPQVVEAAVLYARSAGSSL